MPRGKFAFTNQKYDPYSDASSVCVISPGNQWSRREMSAVFQATFDLPCSSIGFLHDDIIYYYDQNPSGFSFLVLITAFVM